MSQPSPLGRAIEILDEEIDITRGLNVMVELTREDAQVIRAALRELEEREVVAWAPSYPSREFDRLEDGLLYELGERLVAFHTENAAKDYVDDGYPLVPLVRAYKEGG